MATDVTSGREIWLREGKVSDAVRASIAVPGLFRPVLREGRYLVDGGVVNPVPVSLCRAMGADTVIAVDVNSGIVGRRTRRNREESMTQTGRHQLLGKLFPRRAGTPAEDAGYRVRRELRGVSLPGRAVEGQRPADGVVGELEGRVQRGKLGRHVRRTEVQRVAQTYTVSCFFGSIWMRAMRSESGRPRCCQLSPPSVVL